MTVELLKTLCLRFLRTFACGAIATMVMISPLTASGSDWKQVGNWLSALVLAGTIGGITGVLAALDKWVRSS